MGGVGLQTYRLEKRGAAFSHKWQKSTNESALISELRYTVIPIKPREHAKKNVNITLNEDKVQYYPTATPRDSAAAVEAQVLTFFDKD